MKPLQTSLALSLAAFLFSLRLSAQTDPPKPHDCTSLRGDQARNCECVTALFDLIPKLPGLSETEISTEQSRAIATTQGACAVLAARITQLQLVTHSQDETRRELRSTLDLTRAAVTAPPLPDESAGTQGASTQTSSASCVEPVQLATESTSFTMTRTGPRLQLFGAINPLAMLASPESKALLSRLMDVSFLLPLNVSQVGSMTPSTLPTPWDVVEVISLRVRLNFLAGTGLSQKEQLAQLRAFESMVKQADDLQRLLEGRLQESDDLAATVQKLVAGDAKTQAAELLRARDVVDATFAARRATPRGTTGSFGLDLRLDVGDPTFSKSPSALGVSFLGSVAGAVTFRTDDRSFALRARLGGHVFAPTYDPLTRATVGSLDGAFGISFAMPAKFYLPNVGRAQSLALSLGLEGRYAPVPDAGAMSTGTTQFLDVRASINIPLDDGNSLGVGLSLPLIGQTTPMLSLSGNLAQLLGVPSEIPLRSQSPTN